MRKPLEADWEFEVGGNAPVIDALWPGFVDLRLEPDRAWTLSEVSDLRALASALVRLNGQTSPVWTAKCDFWTRLEPGAVDAGELDAPVGEFVHTMGCYIDLLPTNQNEWSAPEAAAESCRRLCARIHAIPLRSCRADLIIRRAVIDPENSELGITAYLTACGATATGARLNLGAALTTFADAVLAHSTIQ